MSDDFEYEELIKEFIARCYKEASKIIEFGPAHDRIAIIKSVLGLHARQVQGSADQGAIEAQAALARLLENQRDVRPQAITAGTNNPHQTYLARTVTEG